MLNRSALAILAALSLSAAVSAQVVIHEIHYHPIELEAFDGAGNPLLDLTDDVHEFVEFYNAGAGAVDISGWTLDGAVAFTLPASTSIAAGGYKVVAKNPGRLQTVYGIAGVLGPYTGALSNKGDTIKLKDGTGALVDSVGYSSAFPWAGAADALGADIDFTLIDRTPYQYKGRSLQRFSAAAGSNDAANWLASPLSPGPTPGSANASSGTTPRPVVVAFNVAQVSDESPVIRATQPVRATFTFSSTASLLQVEVQYFIDDVNSLTDSASPLTVMATGDGSGVFTATIPGQADRSVVRWRVRANRGTGVEPVSPRADDVAIVPVSASAREAWHAYFVQPVRTTTKTAIYDVLVSSIDGTSAAFNGLNGLAAMNYNIIANPKRVTSSASTGLPRALPYVPATDPLWNGSVPCIFVVDGVVRDAHLRYHGSRYNRSAGRNSFKLRFADTQVVDGADSFFVTDKGDYFSVGQGLYINANLPMSEVRWVDWYLNGNGAMARLQQGEYNGDLLDKYHERISDLNPGVPKEDAGEFYKSSGTIEDAGEGPYGHGSERKLLAAGPWTALQRYEWTYALQSHGWKGAKPVQTFIEGMWTARGDTHTAPNPNIPNLRAYLDAQLDVEALLTSLAIASWMCPWDDTTQNHFLWRRANGRWNHVLWDFDAMFGNGDTTGTNSWIYLGENGTPPGGILGNNFRGPNWFKDSVFKSYRTEYNSRLWVLNNTYLSPANLQTLYFRNANGTLQSYYSYINAVKAGFCEARFQSVNTQTGHAADGSDFFRPGTPVHSAPVAGATALPPATFTASAYTHTSGGTAGGNAHAKSKWEIRSTTGGYFAPVFTTTSTTSLTSLAIPFDQLTFGSTYFWRVTYLDASDHPSLSSTETAFAYGPQSANQTLINFSDIWKYDYAGTFTNASWAATAFNDSAWASGPATLAFENQGSIPETIRTVLPAPAGLTPQGRAFYFRRHFNVSVNPATLSNLRIRHLIDDGSVIYINGQRIARHLMNDAATYSYTALSAGNTADGTYQFSDAPTIPPAAQWSWIDPRPFMVQGDNVIAVEVHQGTAGSSDIVFGLEMTATLPATPGDVVINEVLANGSTPDFIELKNATASAIDIAGNGLTDDILTPLRYVFPAGTIIPAGGYLLVWCDSDTAAPGLHTGFGLDSGGQRVVLTNAGAIRDFVAFGPQARGYTIGRVADGTGAFTLTAPTPGAANGTAVMLGGTAGLKINEWLASPAHGEDWFEIYNGDAAPVSIASLWLSDMPATPQITQLPALSYIAGKGASDFVADGTNDGGNRVNFKLSGSGDSLLISSGLTAINSVTFGSQSARVSQGRLPDGSAVIASFPQSSSRAESNWLPSPIVISEALTNSILPLEDQIELFNPTAAAVNIGNWWLSDDRAARRKYQIAPGTTLPAGGYLTLTESQFGAGASPFSLSSLGDEIILTAVDGGGADTGYRAQVTFGSAADDVSFGRIATGWLPEFWPLISRTLGSANTPPIIGPVIINEVHYHPPDIAAADNVRDEFIELHNIGTSAADISGWRVKGGSDFTFPAATTLRPGDYILVVGFNPATDTASLAAFRAALSVPAGTLIYGPFAPKLGNDTASVELARPYAATSVNVDKVEYADFSPWPLPPDGTGPSLQRQSRSVIGNDVANYIAATPTPGAVNTGQTAIADSDGDEMPDMWENANGLDRFSAADANADSDSDGQSNAREYQAGTDPQSGASVFRSSVAKIAGGFRVQFTAMPGVAYSVMARDSLTTGSWVKIRDVAAQGTQREEITDDLTGLARRYYQVVTPQQP